ncbi:MAG: S9 family peptidase [Ichthyobacteriaceae bacterium]|nr:S9 family peptidase [Ichthyobacteriaceae bacterium]
MTAPKAKKIEHKLTKFNDIRIDNYYWLNDREDEEVINYLNAENDYLKEETKHTDDFQKDLFDEMKARIKEDDESVPYKKNGYFYLTQFLKGKEYPIYKRRKESLQADDEIMFDVNLMAKDHAYFELGGLSLSSNNNLCAFGVDTFSRRIYTLQFKNLETGEILDDIIENTTGSCTWANDNKTVFYTKKDAKTLRSHKIFKHVLGTDSSLDVEIFSEKDDTFNTFVYKTKSDKFLVIGSSHTVMSEFRILESDNPNGEFRIFQERERDHEYEFAHYNNKFYIHTNKDGATNFKIMMCDENNTAKENWVDFIPHREDVLLEGMDIFNKYYVLEERANGLNEIRIIAWDGSKDYYLPFSEEAYSANVGNNPDFDSEILRYAYNSLTTPASIIDYNMTTGDKELMKEQEVLGNFNKNNYASERSWATAKDGTKVPMTIVYKKGMKKDGKSPLLLYAYGSYGHTIDPYFSSIRLSLLDRGFTYAIAHIRGSQYLGRQWYEDGKMLKKLNTFTDYIDVAKFLIDNKYTSAQHLYAMGGSAGGMLMGGIINMNPELFNGIISAVPFVDVVTTMLDDSIPLTTGEYDEWGNPNEEEYYNYMKSYSPYDNVEKKAYPNMLVTTGLHDSQVQYWEPAKWVAKLRDYKTNNNKLYMYTNMETGHGGASGRFEALKEVAMEYAFLFDLENIKS